ncbi:hypothetical protein DHD05_10585 [Arenibacter sp. N53]|uniref:dual OB domain-containing protein n=1 Tax=Arenibacter TaxID=178469 RepID=UPI000CD469E8|nr:hypothetical protein [Arenibacter sp. N53]
MEVLITSKTKWSKYYCIGGLELPSNRMVRLMTSIGTYQPLNCPFEIGNIWDLEYNYYPDSPPHIEDVRVIRRNGLVGKHHDFVSYVKNNCVIWNGDFNELYEGKLQWTYAGSGYLNNPNNVPANSVGFWISDNELTWDGKEYYVYERGILLRNRKFKYKGIVPPIDVIPVGTLIRVSLAKWWDAHGEKRCYLQLSGWHL